MAIRQGKLFSAFVLAAGLYATVATAVAQPIKVGWLSSLTGPLSSAALAENEGVKLAVEEINARGGILGRQIELLTRDTAGDPTKAVNFAQQLAFSDKVSFVIGPVNSGEGLAATPILARAGVPTLVIGGNADEATPLAMSQEMVAAIPGARLATIDAAHLSAVERPVLSAVPAVQSDAVASPSGRNAPSTRTCRLRSSAACGCRTATVRRSGWPAGRR